MNMKKQILLIVMTLCAVSAMAVSLPRVSYQSYNASIPTQEGYSLSIGTTFVNHSTVGAYEDVCGADSGFGSSDVHKCPSCCTDNAYDPCIREKGEEAWQECESLQITCINNCEDYALNEYRNPLDAPTAFLLALVAAYGAVAVYRKRMQECNE